MIDNELIPTKNLCAATKVWNPKKNMAYPAKRVRKGFKNTKTTPLAEHNLSPTLFLSVVKVKCLSVDYFLITMGIPSIIKNIQ